MRWGSRNRVHGAIRKGHSSAAGLAAAAGVLLSLGCPADPVSVEVHSGALDATEVVVDLAERAGSARVLRQATVVDVGSADSVNHLVSGWGQPEVVTDSTTSFVWVTSKTAVFETVLFRTDLDRLDLRWWAFSYDGAPEQRVSVEVNERYIDELVLAPRAADYGLDLPAGVLEYGINRVVFHFVWAEPPSEHVGGSTDERTLAAALDRVAFRDTRTGTAVGASGGDPIVDGENIVLEKGVGLRYTLAVPADVVLDLGVSTLPADAPGFRALVWVAGRDGGIDASFTIDPSEVRGGRARFDIHAGDGGVVEIGIAAVDAGEGNGALVVHKPQVLGREGGTRTIASVLLIVVDTLRADYLGAYGADLHTPNVDALAARGVRFAHARSHIPITGPSHASIFTSLLPMEHGVTNNAQELSDTSLTLAESLRAGGRQTAAVVSLGVLGRQFGFDRGFDLYGDGFPRDWLKDAAEVTDEALALAGSALGSPFFLWVHYSDPHEPYAPSNVDYPSFDLRVDGRSIGRIDAGGRGFRFDLDLPAGDSVLEFVPADRREPGRVYRVDNLIIDDPSVGIEALEGWNVIPRRMDRTTYESTFPASVRLSNHSDAVVTTRMLVSCKKLLSKPDIRAAYSGETEFVDLQIGRLLAGLEARGLMDNTLVVFASDHGEGLGNHKHIGHISQLYDSLLDVPLIFNWPGRLPEGVVIDDPVSLIDVFPTVAELLGLESPPRPSGASLAPVMRGGTSPPRAIVAATYRPESFSDKRAIIVDGFKYIHSWEDTRDWEELYDVVDDPGELNDLAAIRPKVLEKLRAELTRRLAEMSETAPVEVALSDEERAQLRALGYVH